ncbi:ATP-binding cassette domain-containing protein [Hoyosella rhizosphaerae]|uniref:ATP-binding cassette domain-containing protein n=1 Tax=Hoyosella rhizosphaerae TaxID=1755582 RepID=UPI00227D3253|nr:ATP-binding cassette domain-containing protein [Hoyosella rhizosphaerae]
MSITVPSGSLTCVTGPSGCGKSTLLNCLGMLEPIDEGRILLDGVDTTCVKERTRTRLYRRKIGFLFQNYALIESDSVDANLDIALTYSDTPKSDRRESKEQALATVGLRGYSARKIHELSGGEQQRVAVARLLIKRPHIILADEPTAALDPINRDVILTLLQALRDSGCAIVLSTHDRFVAKQCDTEISLPTHSNASRS